MKMDNEKMSMNFLYYNPLKFPVSASVYPLGKRTPVSHCDGIFNRLRYSG